MSLGKTTTRARAKPKTATKQKPARKAAAKPSSVKPAKGAKAPPAKAAKPKSRAKPKPAPAKPAVTTDEAREPLVPSFEGRKHPDQEMAELIGIYAAIGTPHHQIAAILKISTKTMQAHYKDALDHGTAKANAVVGGKIFEAARKGEQWACSLWAARRMGWKETSISEIDDKTPVRRIALVAPDRPMPAEDDDLVDDDDGT